MWPDVLARACRIIVSALVLWAVAGCSGRTPTPLPKGGEIAPVSGEIVVFAASSLSEVFNDVGVAFKAKYPDMAVAFNFAGTSTLRTQLERGAKAHVFASANQEQMDLATEAGLVDGKRLLFATNSLVVVVPTIGGLVDSLEDLAKPGVKLVLALKDVPIGGYARQALERMAASGEFSPQFNDQALTNLVSEETQVRQVVMKVALGEADAGIVYSTDVTKDMVAKVKVLTIPKGSNVVALYPIARVKGSHNPAAGFLFLEFVTSVDGQEILAAYGFGAPQP